MEITSFALNNFAPEKFFGGVKFVTMNTPQKFQECRFRLHYESVLWRTQKLSEKINIHDICWDWRFFPDITTSWFWSLKTLLSISSLVKIGIYRQIGVTFLSNLKKEIIGQKYFSPHIQRRVFRLSAIVIPDLLKDLQKIISWTGE